MVHVRNEQPNEQPLIRITNTNSPSEQKGKTAKVEGKSMLNMSNRKTKLSYLLISPSR